jgi:hypothetical protein
MSVTIANLFHRANKCPFACFFKFLLSIAFIYALHIAISHQADVSPYLYILLVALVGVTAVLALASHLNCQLRNVEKTGGIE